MATACVHSHGTVSQISRTFTGMLVGVYTLDQESLSNHRVSMQGVDSGSL